MFILLTIYQGPCEGDSGGPLILQEDTADGYQKSSLVGIVAGGLGCGLNIPTWYSRVSEFRKKL